MPELQAVVGALLRDLTRSRAVGDLASIQVAHDYKKSDLLAAFPIPHFTLDEVTIELKFAISPNQPEPKRLKSDDLKAKEAETTEMVNAAVDDLFVQHPELSSLRGNAARGAANAVIKSYKEYISSKSEFEWESFPDEVSKLARSTLTDRLARGSIEPALSKLLNAKVIPAIDARITQGIRDMIVQIRGSVEPGTPPGLEVIVAADQLAALRADQVSVLKLSIREADRVWAETTLRDGEKAEFLTSL